MCSTCSHCHEETTILKDQKKKRNKVLERLDTGILFYVVHHVRIVLHVPSLHVYTCPNSSPSSPISEFFLALRPEAVGIEAF